MRVGERRFVRAAGDQARDVRHVDHQVRADFVGNRAERGPIPRTRISGAAGDDQLRLVLTRERSDVVHVDQVIVGAHAVRDRLEPLAAHVDRRTVRQVTARIEIEPHETVARRQQRQEHGLVHLAARIGLHVGEIAAEQFLGALDRQVFDDVGIFAAAVITLARIAFGIFVGEDRSGRFEHGEARDIFRRDQFDLGLLAMQFLADRRIDFRIGAFQMFGEESWFANVRRGGGGGHRRALPLILDWKVY